MLKKIIQYINNLWYNYFRVGEYDMKKDFKAIDYAYWFIWYNQVQKIEQNIDDDYDVYEGLSHLKIQKLLYFAEGVYLAVKNKNLFKEKILAWQHGPVIKEVYNILCKNGNKDIEFDNDYYNTILKINDNSEVYNILVSVYNSYAGYTAWQLREKSHVAGGPWELTVDNKGLKSEISRKLIQDYFKNNIIVYED